MGALADFEEDDGAFANDLVDDERGHDHEEYRAEGKREVELPSEDVLVGLVPEVVHDLLGVGVFELLILHELCFGYSGRDTYAKLVEFTKKNFRLTSWFSLHAALRESR